MKENDVFAQVMSKQNILCDRLCLCFVQQSDVKTVVSIILHCPGTQQAKYGSVDPPDYRLDRVSAPTVLFSGAADSLSTKDDNDKLASLLGDAVIHHEVPLNLAHSTYGL